MPPKKRKTYAVRLDKDIDTRKQIAILRMGGVSLSDIAELTGRNLRTIIKEVSRPEHKKIIQRYVTSVGKRKLPKVHAGVVEKVLTKKEAQKT